MERKHTYVVCFLCAVRDNHINHTMFVLMSISCSLCHIKVMFDTGNDRDAVLCYPVLQESLADQKNIVVDGDNDWLPEKEGIANISSSDSGGCLCANKQAENQSKQTWKIKDNRFERDFQGWRAFPAFPNIHCWIFGLSKTPN